MKKRYAVVWFKTQGHDSWPVRSEFSFLVEAHRLAVETKGTLWVLP